MGDHSREQKKPVLLSSAASVLHKCVYSKNIKSTMDSSLPFPKLINFSTCWQIFTWTKNGFEGWMYKLTAGGKLNLAQLLFHVPYSFGYLSPASVIEQDTWASVIPGLGSLQGCLCFLTAPHPRIASSRNDSPIAISGNWEGIELGIFYTTFDTSLCIKIDTCLPLHLEFGYCIIWALLQYLLTWS